MRGAMPGPALARVPSGIARLFGKAPRPPSRPWPARARGAGLAFCLWLAGQAATACEARYPERSLPGRAVEAAFSNRSATGRHEAWAPRDADLRLFAAYAVKTDEYGHGVLGGLRDAKALTIHVSRPGDPRITCPAEVTLPPGHVFEDIAPRLADLDGDGMPEVIVVRSSASEGARLEIYDRRARLVAATPHIGTRFRWLAPAGIGDLDGDGYMEIAYVDRPHLSKTLRIWRYRDGALTELAALPGLSNHRIGEEFITGGLRNCGTGPELVLASGDWRQVMRVRHAVGWQVQPLASFSADAMAAALACKGS
ncbi:FG-GAP repeat domain-containing protein [Ruegeria aquimaris]|uniref:VCBS repeat-containing protein n=1 Tax=Ruegeria aquimaris TaxID=2984333 RepID=A0ABT3AFP7_9RHOB|nr:VCBS repeat-containing protein [Ruegeria sp. XHP0148]MCV2887107.1 VCBS repeat-containing protein [Ruegeria sp. XHP0148]